MTAPEMRENLVVAPEGEDAAPMSSLEGAGVVSSWADVGKAVSDRDLAGSVAALGGAGLDTLGVIADPFDALLGAGLGWVIEHVDVLHEPLDALAGDPTQIKAQAQTWHNVSRKLSQVADQYRTDATAIRGWDGDACANYHGTVQSYTAQLDAVAGQADELAGLILTTGACVDTVRAVIRDLIVDFLTWVAKAVFYALALAPFTMAGSTAAAIGAVGWEAYRLANNLIDRISQLLHTLSVAGGTAGRIADGMRDVAAQARVAAPGWQAVAKASTDTADGLHVAEVVEAGKQRAAADQDRRAWTEKATPAR